MCFHAYIAHHSSFNIIIIIVNQQAAFRHGGALPRRRFAVPAIDNDDDDKEFDVFVYSFFFAKLSCRSERDFATIPWNTSAACHCHEFD
jgi:hypothetical protein